jgi:DNA-binding response OmpR family regulator
VKDKSILIVEDNTELLEQIKEYLSIDFGTVYCAHDGKDGLESFLKNKPDAIFTDINMPKFSGLELIKKIKNYDKNIPIVILSAHTKNEYFIEAIELGVVTYLIKPISSEVLESAVEKVLEKLGEVVLKELNNNFSWDNKNMKLYTNTEEISLSEYEQLFIKTLYENINECVSFIDLHIAINEDNEFSKNSITSIVKRIRQKTHKDFISTCYMQGFKLEIK